MFLIFVFFNHLCFSQTGDKLIQTVLKKNEKNKTFSFDSSNKKRADEYYKIYITYLGNIKTNDSVRKIVTAKTEFGTNRHTSGSIFIYDTRNKYLGKYNLGDGLDLPGKIEKDQILFFNTNKKECDPTLVTKIDFSKEIPQKIFLKCKGEYGDVYSFSVERD